MMPSGPLRTQNRQDAILLNGVPVVLPGFAGEQVASPGVQPARPIKKSGNDNIVVFPRSIPLKTISQLMCSTSKPARSVCLPWVQEIVSAIWYWSVGLKTSSPMPPPKFICDGIVMGFITGMAGLIGVIPSCVAVNGTPLLLEVRLRWNDRRPSFTSELDRRDVSLRAALTLAYR